ncbi:MAG: response regulator transcription factor [Bacillota bacterium]
MAQTILVVDDQESIVRLVTYGLEQAGYRTVRAYDGVTALSIAEQERPDLIVLDLMLPGLDGLEVCRRLRLQGIATPIIMLTARGEEIDRVLGLELGADDYMAKPFSPRELVARVRSVLRRTNGAVVASGQILRFGPLVINLDEYTVAVDGSFVTLTPREFELLAFLARHAGKVFSREQILDQVWGYEFAGETRLVDMHISNVRNKIEADAKNPRYLLTVRGVGYKLERCQ